MAKRRNSEMEVGVASEAPIGTRVEPRAASSQSAVGHAEILSAADSDAPVPSVLTILVADDDPEVRTYAGQVLRTHGYHVLLAAGGVEALEVAAQHVGPIHLLLADIVMPHVDGRELDRRLNQDRPETRTLFMSGYFDARLPPGAALLCKPFIPRALVRKVNELLGVTAGSAGRKEYAT